MYSLTRSAGEKFYSNVSNIDLAKLLFDTRTKYFVFHCQLQWIDCRRFWSLRYTQRGACLQLQPQAVYNYDKKTKLKDKNKALNKNGLPPSLANIETPIPEVPGAYRIKELQITVAYNKSDFSFGWNGFNNALTLFYTHQDEKYVSKDHSYPLVGGLSPTVSFTLVQTKYLGLPFTECVKDENYTQRACEATKLIDKIIGECGCYPSYDELFEEHQNETRPCSFFEHSTCVASIRNKFDPSDHNCLPSCNLTSIHQESIHYTKMDQAEGDYMRKIAKTQAIKVNLKELVLVSTTLKVAELSKVVFEETPNYTSEQLVSDIGGALGLALGLNILDLLMFSGSFAKTVIQKIRMAIGYIRRTVKKKGLKKLLRSDHFEKLGGKEEKEPRRRSRKIKTHVRSYTINLKSERTKSISVDESEENRLWNGCPSMSHTLTHKDDPYVTHKEEEIACQRSLVASDNRLKCNNLKIQWNNLQ